GARHNGMSPFRAGLLAIAAGAAGFILVHERLRLPLIQSSPMKVNADVSTAQAITPGQGHTVRVAGVKIGDIGGTQLKHGRAVVPMEIDPKHKHLLHQDATALLRPKTGLKDMFIEVEPGSDQSPLLHSGSTLPIQNTA